MNDSQRTPPRFVPTLTAVVQEPQVAALDESLPTAAQVALSQLSEANGDAEALRLEEQLLHRVLQRVDASLEERLTDAVSGAVQQQLDSMLPRLRTEIEQVLRALVVEALALELTEIHGSTPTASPRTFG